VTPASGIFFNVLCYAGMVLLLSKTFPSGVPSTLAILSITVSPALLVVGTQFLKDTLCIFLIVTTAAGVSLWANSLARVGSGRLVLLTAAGGLICLSTYLFAGIRTYFALLMLASLVAMSVWAVVTKCGGLLRRRIAMAHFVLVAGATLSAATGGGPYFDYYTGLTRVTLSRPAQSVAVFDQARARFIASGGNTNFGDEVSLSEWDSESPTTSVATRVRFFMTGVAAMFVPISVLKGLSIVDFQGGRGLLFITDVDTLILDLALIFALYSLVTRRSEVELRLGTVFVLTLGVLTTIAMAYVVTNFGTLFRLRLLAIVPLWLLPAFALSHSRRMGRISSVQET
jgi:hypothetical protein